MRPRQHPLLTRSVQRVSRVRALVNRFLHRHTRGYDAPQKRLCAVDVDRLLKIQRELDLAISNLELVTSDLRKAGL